MKTFFFKVILFLLPFGVANIALLLEGYLFSTKNNYILIHNLLSYEPGKLNVKFYGTSRIENGISPDDFVAGYLEVDNRSPLNAQNCGMSAQMPGWGLKMQEEYYAPCDLMIIEIHPGKDPLQDAYSGLKRIGRTQYTEEFLSYYLNRVSVIHHVPFFLSDIRGKLAIRHMNCFTNGWNELVYSTNETTLETVKNKVSGWAEDDLKRGRFLEGWETFSGLIRQFQQKHSFKVVFIRMPVDGRLRDLNDKIVETFDPMVYLKQQFPESIVIDALNTTELSGYKTIEGSHLNGNDAREFSKTLGKYVAKAMNEDKKDRL